MNQLSNVQIIVQEPYEDSVDSEVRLFMVGESGVIAKRALGTQERRDESSSESPRDEGGSVSGEVVRGLQGEVATLMEQLKAEKDRADKAENELASLRAEADAADRLKIELRREKEKYKQVWRMNCEQLAEYDAATTAIDEEMAALREQLRVAELAARTTPGPGTEEAAAVGGRGTAGTRMDAMVTEVSGARHELSHVSRRRGKAPPVDSFTGEDPEIQLDDWLPTLLRASQWNEWVPEELLMQLAGHLRGRALQEWDLLEDHEKNNSESALKTLRSRLDSGNKILAAQDFRRTAQRETESVPDFIRRLERAFRIAYGRDCLTQETK